MVNSTICSWLLNIIDPKLRSTVAYTHITKTMWDDIKKRYNSSDMPKKHSLKTKIANCKQGEGMSAVDYYFKLVGYWNELDGVLSVIFVTAESVNVKTFGLILSRKPKRRKLINF